MSAVCYSKFPEIIAQVVSLSAFQSFALSLLFIIELFLTTGARPLIIEIGQKTRTASVVLLPILIQFFHYNPHKHSNNLIHDQSDIISGKALFVIDDSIDGFKADEKVQEQESVMHLKIQATVAGVLLELQAVGDWDKDVQVFHWQEQDNCDDKGRRQTLCDIFGYSENLHNYFDRFYGQYQQQCLCDGSPRIRSFSSIQNTALKPQNYYLFDLPAQENNKEMRVHLRPSFAPQQDRQQQYHHS